MFRTMLVVRPSVNTTQMHEGYAHGAVDRNMPLIRAK